MTRLGLLVVTALLALGVVYGATANVSASTSGTIATPIGEVSGEAAIKGNVRIDHVPTNVRVISAERTEGHVKLFLSIELPNPCYSIRTKYKAVEEGDEFNVDVFLNLVEPEGMCIQVVQFMELNIDLNVPGDAPVRVNIYSEKIREGSGTEMVEEEKEITGETRITVESPVPYEKEIENNVLILKFKGCYDYQVVPMRCPNCYTVYLERSEGCEKTEIRLKLIPGFEGVVKVTFKGEVRENAEEICGKIRAIAKEYNEEVGKKVSEICSQGGLERACEILKEYNVPAAEVVCKIREGNVPVIGGVERLIQELKQYAPDVAVELETLYREGRFWEMKEKACELLKEKNEELFKKLCEELEMPAKEEAEEKVGERVKKIGEANTIEELKKEVERLRKELERYKKEIQELRLKIEELKRKILVTPRGIVDVETNQEINVPRVAIEVKVKRKPVVVKKEENTIAIEVNGPIRAVAMVKVPVEVEENAIVVGGKPIKVLPDEIIQKIRERIKAEKIEDVELEEEENKPVYRVKARMRGRLLFLIPVEVPTEVYVDAEAGTEVKVQKPWWAFLVFG